MLTLASAPRARAALLAASHGRRPALTRVLSTRPTAEVAKAAATAVVDA
jgi:hypothetical protein